MTLAGYPKEAQGCGWNVPCCCERTGACERKDLYKVHSCLTIALLW